MARDAALFASPPSGAELLHPAFLIHQIESIENGEQG